MSRRLSVKVAGQNDAVTLDSHVPSDGTNADVDVAPDAMQEALDLNDKQRELARDVLAGNDGCLIETGTYSGLAFVDTRASHSSAHRIRLNSDPDTVLELVAIGQATIKYPVIDPSLPVAVHGYTIGETFYMTNSPLLCTTTENAHGYERVSCTLPDNTASQSMAAADPNHEFENMTQANSFAEGYLQKRRLYKERSWSKGTQKVLVIFTRPSTDSNAEMPTDQDIATGIDSVEKYFVENSGGAFIHSIEKYESVVTIGHYSQFDGAGNERCCSTNGKCAVPDYNYIHLEASNAVKNAKGEAFMNSWDRISVVIPPCARIGWAGLGVVLGAETWINGFHNPDSFARVLAHELGHNLGK
jgi:hypothetical protein